MEDIPKEFLERQWFFDFAKLHRSLGPNPKIDLQPILDALEAKGVGIESLSGLRMNLLSSAVSNDFGSVLKTLRESIDGKHPHVASGLAFVAWLPFGVMSAAQTKQLLLMALEIGSFGQPMELSSGPVAVRRTLWGLMRRKRYPEMIAIVNLLVEMEELKLEGAESRAFRLSVLLEDTDWRAKDADSLVKAFLQLASHWTSAQDRQLQLYERWADGLLKADLSDHCGVVLEHARKHHFDLPARLQKKLKAPRAPGRSSQ